MYSLGTSSGLLLCKCTISIKIKRPDMYSLGTSSGLLLCKCTISIKILMESFYFFFLGFRSSR